MSESQTHYRAVPSQLVTTAGATAERGPRLTGRLVPYGVVATVLDETPDGPDLYQEGFRRGAFALQAKDKRKGIITKIGLVHRHDNNHGSLGYLGTFQDLRDEPDGLWGDVDILRSKTDDVVDLLRSGIDELSIEFRVPRGEGNTEVDENKVRWRVKAHLDGVALEPKGAYQGAQVMALRAQLDKEKAAAAEELARKSAEEAKEAEEMRAAQEAAEQLRHQAEAEIEAKERRKSEFEELLQAFERLEYKEAETRQRELERRYLGEWQSRMGR